MNQEEAFWQSILDEPEVDANRLIYADWLEDQGDRASMARAEFIRVQIELTATPDPARRKTLAAREKKLLATRGQEWLQPLEKLGCLARHFRRGFVEQIDIPTLTFVKNAEKIYRVTPVRHLVLCLTRGYEADLAACPWLARIVRLALPANRIGPEGAQRLAGSAHVGQIEELWLSRNDLGVVGLSALLQAGAFPKLTSLDLRFNDLGQQAVRGLTEAPALGELRQLNLADNRIDGAALRILLAATNLPQLTSLDLSNNNLDTPAVEALAVSPLLGQLTTLGLAVGYSTRPNVFNLQALAESPLAAGLRRLRISDSAAGLRALARSPHLGNLTDLEVIGYRLDEGLFRELKKRFGTGLRSPMPGDAPPLIQSAAQ